jgi:RNA recognition motif-containing protein
MKIFVGNLSFDIKENELRDLFAPYGNVASVSIATDRYTGRPRGFGFVEMESDEAGNAAIEKLNGTTVNSRAITVNEARPQQRQERGGDGGNFRKY